MDFIIEYTNTVEYDAYLKITKIQAGGGISHIC